jgi:hypothetical protein
MIDCKSIFQNGIKPKELNEVINSSKITPKSSFFKFTTSFESGVFIAK